MLPIPYPIKQNTSLAPMYDSLFIIGLPGGHSPTCDNRGTTDHRECSLALTLTITLTNPKPNPDPNLNLNLNPNPNPRTLTLTLTLNENIRNNSSDGNEIRKRHRSYGALLVFVSIIPKLCVLLPTTCSVQTLRAWKRATLYRYAA